MADKSQFKSFTTRRFRADLHYRLRLVAAMLNTTQEIVFNDVMELGLTTYEKKIGASTVRESGQEKGGE